MTQTQIAIKLVLRCLWAVGIVKLGEFGAVTFMNQGMHVGWTIAMAAAMVMFIVGEMRDIVRLWRSLF